MENYNYMVGTDTNLVVKNFENNGYELNFMPVNRESHKSLFYAKKNDVWIEFCTTVENTVYGSIVWAVDYNWVLDECAKNLERLEIEYKSKLN